MQFKEAVVFGPVVLINANNEHIESVCSYSWSSDSVCWTSWVDYNSYLRIASNIDGEFFLRILIADTLSHVFINAMETKCYTMCLYNTNPFIEDFCSQTLFDPYANLDCALQLQNQLSNSVICMLGIPIYYFRVLPDKESADYTFKEYVMHNVESVKQMKMMIQDGTMPSSKPNFSDLDFDWETDWDVELSKDAFAMAFGDESFPKQRDFIYVPMQKRMWEVNSAYDEKNEGLLWHSTTWKLGLIKWNEKTNVDQNDFENVIDNLIVNKYENVFAELETNEQERTSSTAQIEKPTYTANNLDNVFLQDNVRKALTKDLISIINVQYNNRSLVVGKNAYSFKKNGTIIYQKPYCSENGTLSFILDRSQISQQIDYKPVIGFGDNEISTNGNSLKFGNAQIELVDDIYLVVCRWNHKTFVQEICAYPYITPKNVPLYKVRPEMHYFDFEKGISCTSEYSNSLIADDKHKSEVILTGYPFMLTNIKLYNKYLSEEQVYKEIAKYTTTSKSCIINDLARPLDTGNGYSVR